MTVSMLGAAPAQAAQNDPRLPRLFVALKAAQSPGWAHVLEQEITHIWTQSADPETQQLMEKGLTLMAEDEAEAALKAFDAVVAHAPNFAEAWNQRATVEFLLGDYRARRGDIARALELEPRHFGALAALGQVELALGNKAAALDAFNRALAIDPHLRDIADLAEHLKEELQRKAI